MKCVFCGSDYKDNVGCCDMAAMTKALTVIKYHCECGHEEVNDVVAQLSDRINSRYAMA